MQNLIIGGFSDQIYYYAWAMLSKSAFTFVSSVFANNALYNDIFFDMLYPLTSNQPFSYLLLSLGISYLGINFFNFWCFASVLLTFVLTKKALSLSNYSWVLALLFTLSPFMWIHFGMHIELMYLWIIPATYILVERYLLTENLHLKGIVLLGFALGTFLGFSNYLGFISVLGTYLVLLSHALIYRQYSNSAKKFAVLTLTLLIFGGLVFHRQILANYSPVISDGIDYERYTLKRPIEDFYTFSGRPWYFFIPSTLSPIYSDFAKNIHGSIKNTNYYLADDYFAYEHSASFFGYSFLVALILCFLYRYKRLEKKDLLLLLSVVFIFLLTLPPMVTISGLKIYTPGFLIYKFFPMFRVSARFVVFIHFLLLCFVGRSLNKLNFKNSLVVCFVGLLVLIETYIPAKFDTVVAPSEIYKNVPQGSSIVVYPYSKLNEALLQVSSADLVLLNPRFYFEDHINSEIFTKELTSNPQSLKPIGAEYLITLENDLSFDNSPALQKIFSNTEGTLYKVL